MNSPLSFPTRAGRALLCLATLAYGVLCFAFSNFVSGLQPVPEWVGARLPLAWLTGAVLIAAAAWLAVSRRATAAALLLAVIHLFWATVLCLPLVATSPALFGLMWIGCFENFAFAGAMLALAVSLRDPLSPDKADRIATRVAFLARPLYGAALLVFAFSHFKYPDFVAALIPAWIPGKLFFAWLTGAAHFATGIAVLAGVATRIACLWHAAMCFIIFAVLHIPRVAADSGNRGEWTSMFVALALCGAALVCAALSARRARGPLRHGA
jgi:uncharacterized membrane protein YphA (DoxX/SURF4 family)